MITVEDHRTTHCWTARVQILTYMRMLLTALSVPNVFNLFKLTIWDITWNLPQNRALRSNNDPDCTQKIDVTYHILYIKTKAWHITKKTRRRGSIRRGFRMHNILIYLQTVVQYQYHIITPKKRNLNKVKIKTEKGHKNQYKMSDPRWRWFYALQVYNYNKSEEHQAEDTNSCCMRKRPRVWCLHVSWPNEVSVWMHSTCGEHKQPREQIPTRSPPSLSGSLRPQREYTTTFASVM